MGVRVMKTFKKHFANQSFGLQIPTPTPHFSLNVLFKLHVLEIGLLSASSKFKCARENLNIVYILYSITRHDIFQCQKI